MASDIGVWGGPTLQGKLNYILDPQAESSQWSDEKNIEFMVTDTSIGIFYIYLDVLFEKELKEYKTIVHRAFSVDEWRTSLKKIKEERYRFIICPAYAHQHFVTFLFDFEKQVITLYDSLSYDNESPTPSLDNIKSYLITGGTSETAKTNSEKIWTEANFQSFRINYVKLGFQSGWRNNICGVACSWFGIWMIKNLPTIYHQNKENLVGIPNPKLKGLDPLTKQKGVGIWGPRRRQLMYLTHVSDKDKDTIERAKRWFSSVDRYKEKSISPDAKKEILKAIDDFYYGTTPKSKGTIEESEIIYVRCNAE